MAAYDLLGRTRQQLLAEPLLGEAEGEGSMRVGKFPTFYIDDSACEIAGKKHIILAALSFADEEKAINSWLCKKRELGLTPPPTRSNGTASRFPSNTGGNSCLSSTRASELSW